MSLLYNVAATICSIIAFFHFIAAAIVIWIFMPVGLAIFFVGLMFFSIAIVLNIAANKARKKEQEQKEEERG